MVMPSRVAVASVMAVSMNPGAIEFAVIPKGPSSIASVRVKPCMPALAADHRDTVPHTRHVRVPFCAGRFRGTPITVFRNGR
jgi:hypothetical protein